MIKACVATAILLFASSAVAQTLSIGSVQVELANGWIHSVKGAAALDARLDDRVTIRNPGGVGDVTIQTLAAPENVSAQALRLLTNVEETEPLTMQVWGDYSGYQHDFVENEVFYRIWWLARDEQLVFVTYQCTAELLGSEIHDVEQIVLSLRAISPSA